MEKVITFTNSGDTDVYVPLMGQSGAFKVIPAKVDDTNGTLELDGDDIVWYPASDYETFYTDFLAQYPQVSMATADSDKYDVTVALALADGTAVTIDKVTVGTEEFTDVANIKVKAGTYDVVIEATGYNDITLEGVVITAGTNSIAVYGPTSN